VNDDPLSVVAAEFGRAVEKKNDITRVLVHLKAPEDVNNEKYSPKTVGSMLRLNPKGCSAFERQG